jgi:hypothetical protein
MKIGACGHACGQITIAIRLREENAIRNKRAKLRNPVIAPLQCLVDGVKTIYDSPSETGSPNVPIVIDGKESHLLERGLPSTDALLRHFGVWCLPAR